MTKYPSMFRPLNILLLTLGACLLMACPSGPKEEPATTKTSKDSITTPSGGTAPVSTAPGDPASKKIPINRVEAPVNPVFHLDSCHSPAGLIIEVWSLGDVEGQYYFFKDHRLVNRFYQESALVGTWQIEDSVITIKYDTKYYRKGIGEPIPLGSAAPGNYIERYEQYEYLSEDYVESETYDWNEIKQEIQETSELYQLVSTGLDNKTFSKIIDLTIDLD